MENTKKIMEALRPFSDALTAITSAHTEGWAERKGRHYVLFSYADFHFTLGMVMDAAEAFKKVEGTYATEQTFERIHKYLEEHPVEAKESWDKTAKDADERFERFLKSLTPEHRAKILEENAMSVLQRHHFGPSAMEYFRDMDIQCMLRDAMKENEELRMRLEGDKFEQQGR